MPYKKRLPVKAGSLKKELSAWFQQNNLTEDTFWLPCVIDPVGTGSDLRLSFEGDLNDVLWVRSFDDHDSGYSARLRLEFDAIVKKHGFRFEFKDETSGNFYEQER